MISKIKEKYYSYQSNTGFMGIFFNPFYFARKGLVENIKSNSKYINGLILDVGCGNKPYKELFNYTDYVGLEYDTVENRKNKLADIFYDGEKFPFENSKFDSVINNQVLEHIFNPESFLKEINRVIKKNGFLLITVPFVWDEHEQPNDYARYSSFGIQHLLKKNGFEIVKAEKSINDIRVIFQLLNVYVFKKFLSGNGYFNILLTLLFFAPINIWGELFSKILPKNDDLYLDNIIIGKKITDV